MVRVLEERWEESEQQRTDAGADWRVATQRDNSPDKWTKSSLYTDMKRAKRWQIQVELWRCTGNTKMDFISFVSVELRCFKCSQREGCEVWQHESVMLFESTKKGSFNHPSPWLDSEILLMRLEEDRDKNRLKAFTKSKSVQMKFIQSVHNGNLTSIKWRSPKCERAEATE